MSEYDIMEELTTAEQIYLLYPERLSIEQATLMAMFCAINRQCTTVEQAVRLSERWIGSKRNTVLRTGKSEGISQDDWGVAIITAQSYVPELNRKGYINVEYVKDSPEFRQFCELFDLEHVTTAIRKFYNYKGRYAVSYCEALKSKGMSESDILFTIIQYIGKVASMCYKTECAHCQILAGLLAIRSDGQKYQDKPTKRTEYSDCMRNIEHLIDGVSPKHRIEGQWISLM